jgi:acetyl-CoA carboxylase biotin carboxyl carrier protein
MALSDEDVREILRIIDESQLSELHLTTEGFVLHVVRGGAPEKPADSPPGATRGGESAVSPGAPVGRGRGTVEATTPDPAGARGHVVGEAIGASAAGGPGRTEEEASVVPAAADRESADDDGTVTIAAPMLGTFYRAESPGEAPFVEVGSRVGADTTVGIIEVMKMMNSVPAGVAGTIVEVCLENGEVVESGAPLFRVQPDSNRETGA